MEGIPPLRLRRTLGSLISRSFDWAQDTLLKRKPGFCSTGRLPWRNALHPPRPKPPNPQDKVLRPWRPVAVGVLVCFSWLSLEPWHYLLWWKSSSHSRLAQAASPTAPSPEAQLAQLLKDLEAQGRRFDEKVQAGKDATAEANWFGQAMSTLASLHGQMQGRFKEIEQQIVTLPAEIHLRHQQAVLKYEQSIPQVQQALQDLGKEATPTGKAAKTRALADLLQQINPQPQPIPLDPHNLPHRVLDKQDWPQEAYTPQRKAFLEYPSREVVLAATDAVIGFLTTPVIGAVVPPGSEYLVETLEVKFTPDIQNLATQLERNPVHIFNWVRNNILYQPHYGSLKGAQRTLMDKTGNDLDQASLLIALLRSSGIHARYVTGTVEIPAAKAMNWVGGVTDPKVMAQIFASHGIPGKALVWGGTIQAIAMEHVWVEAFVDYIPSRGAVHKQGDTWVPMDPSFKQHTFKNAVDFHQATGFNGEAFLQQYLQGTGEDTPYQAFSQQFLAYLEARVPGYDLQEAIGDIETFEPGNNIVQENRPILMGTLPYPVTAIKSRYAAIPEGLRRTVTLQVLSPLTGDPDVSYSLVLSEWANQRVSLAYEPATAADDALVQHYGGLLQVPPYLLQVKPVLRVEGTVMATGSPLGLGADQTMRLFYASGPGKIEVVTNTLRAGSYTAVTLLPGQPSLEFTGFRVALLQDAIDKVPLGTATLDEVLGELLHTIGLQYFYQLSFQEQLYASTFQVLLFRQPSEALMAVDLLVKTLFGVPVSVQAGGLTIDVDRNLYLPFPKDGRSARTRDFMFVSGTTMSAWEHGVFQLDFPEPAVSAVKLLQLAGQQGIAVLMIDGTNLNQVLPALQVSAAVKADIQNAINAGNKAIVSQTNVQHGDFVGAGYILYDPATGVGAFKISNETSGGWSGAKLPPDQKARDEIYARLCPGLREKILEIARHYIRTPYRWGGKKPETGFDCSGFVYYVYKHAGIEIKHGPAQVQYTESPIKPDFPLRSDLVFYGRPTDQTIYHVGIISARDIMINSPNSDSYVRGEVFWGAPKFFGSYITKTCP